MGAWTTGFATIFNDFLDVQQMISDMAERFGMQTPSSVLYTTDIKEGSSAEASNTTIRLPRNEFDRSLDNWEEYQAVYRTVYHEMRHVNASYWEASVDFWHERFTGNLGPYHRYYDWDASLTQVPYHIYYNRYGGQ